MPTSPRWLLTCVLLVPSGVDAQPRQEEEAIQPDREVLTTGTPDAPPVIVHGAANVGVHILFDAPLRWGGDAGTVVLPGGDVRPHPYLQNVLVVTPSAELTARGPVPFQAPLADGGVSLQLTFNTGRIDHVLGILRRPRRLDAGTAPSIAAFRVLFKELTPSVFDKLGTCNPQETSSSRVKEIRQDDRKGDAVCVFGDFTYVKVQRNGLECIIQSGRLFRGEDEIEVAYVGSSLTMEDLKTHHVVVLSTPPEHAQNHALWLLDAEGTVCERRWGVKLGPGGSSR